MDNYQIDSYSGAEIEALLGKIDNLGNASQSAAGLMSASDKTKLDGLDSGAQANVLEGVKIAGADLPITEKKVNIPADSSPTSGSNSLVCSGGVFNAIKDFITRSVNDLVNYYTKTEVNNIIGSLQQFHYEIYASTSAVDNPQSNVLYLIGPTGTGSDKYEEYVYSNGWVKIGDTTIDLSGYSTTEQMNAAINNALEDYATKEEVSQLGQQVIYDITVNNADAKFASLSALLSSENLSTLIPIAVRCGGMSIRFVQTSDNKYVQYRLMTDAWSTNAEDWSIADEGVYIDNPEFVYVQTDKDDKILWAIKTDGSIYYGAGVPQQVIDYIDEKLAELSLDEYEDIVAFLSDYLGSDTTLKTLLDSKLDAEGLDSNALNTIQTIDNPEFIEVTTDAEGKVLSGTKVDGSHYAYNIQSETIEVKVDKEEGKSLIDEGVSESLSAIDDPEGRSEITTDSEGKIISYRDSDGVKHEEVGIAPKSIIFSDESINDISNIADKRIEDNDVSRKVKKYNLPSFGYVNIAQETFYLTSDNRYSDKDGVYLIQDYPDTQENAQAAITLSYFYIKSTLVNNGDGTYSKHNDGVEGHDVKLDFYAASKVTLVSGLYYVTSTLTEIVDPVTGDVSYEVNDNSINVTKIVDIPPYKAWSVDKKTEHYCVVEIDFGDYLSGNFYVGVKYQGSSTLFNRKRNWRFRFYKNSSYSKKNKIKIGEFIRTNDFNLKANYSDASRIVEYIMNILFMAIWEDRSIYDQYPWNKEHTPYTGATGMIKGFPARVSVGGVFYGFHIFGLKKDKLNYLLDDDASGIFVGGESNGSSTYKNWIQGSWTDWEDELNDDGMSESNKNAMTTFYNFINGRLEDENQNIIPFDKINIPERMSVIDFIDYLICLQVFFMRDNTCRNMILYTGPEKKKFYPFFYDLDLSWRFTTSNYDADIMVEQDGSVYPPPGSYAWDMSLWENFKNLYWDEIINRYNQLRQSVLNIPYITKVYENVINALPDNLYEEEKQRWGAADTGDKDTFKSKIAAMAERLEWLDNEYYK